MPCLRCGGQVIIDDDEFGARTVCLQCGRGHDVTNGAERLVPLVPIAREPGRRSPRVGGGMSDETFERWQRRTGQKAVSG